MFLTYDPIKRARTLAERGLDFLDAACVFSEATWEAPDDRKIYGELRMLTMGVLRDRLVVVVWTQRGDSRRIISMRYANEREREES